MNDIQITICIFIHPSIRFLDNILSNLINQEFNKREIICITNNIKNIEVNNILDYYKEKHDIKVFSQKNKDILKNIRGKYLLLLESNTNININLKEYYNIMENSETDIISFNPAFEYIEDINERIITNVNSNDNLFELPKYLNEIIRVSYLKENNIMMPFSYDIIEELPFYFKTRFLTNKIIISKKNVFTKRIYNPYEYNEYLTTNCQKQSLVSKNMQNINSDILFEKINEIMKFFEENSLYQQYKYQLLNYIFNILINLYKNNFNVNQDYYNHLKEFMFKLDERKHNDLVLYLENDYLRFLNRIKQSNNYNELKILNEKEELIKENEKLLYKLNNKNYFLDKFNTSRFDIKNEGNETNNVEVLFTSDNNALIDYPIWFKNKKGNGLLIESTAGKIFLKLKCINDGKISIKLRGKDFKDLNKEKIPIFIDFTKLKINDQTLINKNRLISHVDTYQYSKQVKNGEEITIYAQWLPINENSNFKEIKNNKKQKDRKNTSKKIVTNENINKIRVDINNYGKNDNNLEIVSVNDSNIKKIRPSWLKTPKGQGLVMESSKKSLDVKLKCIRKGNLNVKIRGIDFRDKESSRIPIFINIKKIIINDKIILNKNHLVCHDKPFIYNKPVDNDEIIKINITWDKLDNKIEYAFEKDNIIKHGINKIIRKIIE